MNEIHQGNYDPANNPIKAGVILTDQAIDILADNVFGGVEICKFDDDFTILYANKGFFELTGYTKSDLFAEHQNKHTALIYGDSSQLKQQIASQLQSKNHFSVEYQIKRADGAVIWVLDKGALIEDKDKNLLVQCTITDITEQKKAQEEIKLSKTQYEVAMSYSDVTMYEYHVPSHTLVLHERDASFWGVDTVVPNGPETFVRKGIILPEFAKDFLSMYQRIEQGEKTASCVVKVKSADKQIQECELTLISVFDDLGKPVHAVGVHKNVSAILKLEREKEYASILVSNQTLIYEANVTQNKIIKYDPSWAASVGASAISSLDALTQYLCENVIFGDDCPQIKQALSPKALAATFEEGQKLLTLEYRKIENAGQLAWYSKTIHIIKDRITGDIHIRCYVKNIQDNKTKEATALKERKLYETMIAKASIVYAVNVTKNKFISGHEKWGELFGVTQSDNYTAMITQFGNKALHPDDLLGFNQCFLRQNILEAYFNGTSEIIYDYRRPDESGEYIWVRCNFHLFEDIKTGDLTGYSYVENINEEKLRELSLIYKAEHDALTGLYNKDATEKHITEFLSTGEGKSGRHAFFIMDIDHFKEINDTFGHVFGDAVISQTGSKIQDLFRDIDILGRIGGDEYIAFMKNIGNTKIAHKKAEEILSKLTDSFTKNGVSHSVSVSIGIAFFNKHGKNYEQLYKHSDAALYASKNRGRNRYTVFDQDMSNFSPSVKAIKENEYFQPKDFENNIAEYVFRILYESTDKNVAINTVLELVGKHYHVSRAYIFEKFESHETLKNTFEWCNNGIVAQKDFLQEIPTGYLSDHGSDFFENGFYYLPDVRKIEQPVRSFLERQQIKSVLQFSIVQDGEFKGFVGFDECTKIRPLLKNETAVLQNISNILGVFILAMRALEKLNMEKQLSLSIINNMDTFAYVCDPDSYKLLFANEKTLAALPDAKIGNFCYQVIRGQQSPCEVCPMKIMQQQKLSHYSMNINNSNLGKTVHVSGSWIDWTHGTPACLINGFDLVKIHDNLK